MNLQQTPTEPTLIEKITQSWLFQYGLKIIWAILVIIILLLISKIIAWSVKRYILKSSDPNNKQSEKIAKLIHDIVFYILIIFSFFIGFEIVGFNVGLIVGWISFGVWLAFKEILGNMFAGIMILYTKEFKLWDIIEINADQVYFGKIEEITIRYTIIRTIDLRSVVIPNMTLISVPIKTYSSESLIKMIIPFRTHYDTDTEKAIEVIASTINTFDFVKNKENTKVFLSDFLDSSLEFKAIITIDPNCGILPEVIKWTIYTEMNKAFEKNNIVVPYNMITLTFENDQDKRLINQQLSSSSW